MRKTKADLAAELDAVRHQLSERDATIRDQAIVIDRLRADSKCWEAECHKMEQQAPAAKPQARGTRKPLPPHMAKARELAMRTGRVVKVG